MKKILLGSITALISFVIILYVIEYDRSTLQVVIGFLLFIFPFTFISLFKSTTSIFILVFFTAVTIYIIFKYSYYDIFIGVLLALVIGGSIFYFRIHKFEVFSQSNYKELSKNLKDKEDK